MLAGVAQSEGGCERQIAAGGIAADREPRRIDAEPRALARNEPDHRHHFLEGHWKLVLRR